MSQMTDSAKTAATLFAASAAWAVAGMGTGLVVAWRTIVANDSIRTVADAFVVTAWVVLLYASAFAFLGMVAWTLAPRRAGSARAVAHLAAAYTFAGIWMLGNSIAEYVTVSTASSHLVALAVPTITALLLSLAGLHTVWRSLRASTVPLLLALAVPGVLLFAIHGAAAVRGPERDGVRPQVTAAPRRVLVIALDGAEWNFIDPLLAAGRLPTFRSLLRTGVRSPLRTIVPTLSPIIWTTIATGAPERLHGIHGFTELQIPGLSRGVQGLLSHPVLAPRYARVREAAYATTRAGLAEVVPITAHHRRVKAIWNILSDADVRVAVVNWFATWPAEPVYGHLVSDRNRIAFRDGAFPSLTASTDGLMYPAQLRAGLESALAADADGVTAPQHFFSTQPSARDLERFDGVYASDRFAANAARLLITTADPQFVAVYLAGLDVCAHYFLKWDQPLIERYYDFVDTMMGRLIAAAGPDATVLVVSDHGWGFRPGETFSHFHGPDGVLILSGPGISPARQFTVKPTIDDITPTLLALMGLPKARYMPGRVLSEVLPSDVRAPAVIVDSYGPYTPPTVTSARSAVATETVERLRALGYEN
jgi:hypothetical protein